VNKINPEKNEENSPITKTELQEWLIKWIAKEVRIQPDQITTNEPLVNFGLGSHDAVALTGDLEDWLGRELEPTLAWDYPTIDKLSDYLSQPKPQ